MIVRQSHFTNARTCPVQSWCVTIKRLAVGEWQWVLQYEAFQLYQCLLKDSRSMIVRVSHSPCARTCPVQSWRTTVKRLAVEEWSS